MRPPSLRCLHDLTEREVREALSNLTPLSDELFPTDQQRIVRLLVERATVGHDGAGDRRSAPGHITLRVAGLASLVRDLTIRPAA